METYILILMLTTSKGVPVTTNLGEYDRATACTLAGIKAKGAARGQFGLKTNVSYICLPKQG